MIRLTVLILILLNSCSQSDKANLSKSVDFNNFFNLSVDEYKKKLEKYNKSNKYPNIDKWKKNIT